ncbi:polysaccharide deacetylase family protein [Echinicola strongylocentroti]|uniref:Polysaccharide deacetylase family protein n=1 Tax=Echinicola strongylocentroti TaxID=1795355 RepID=A0A2Z4INN9_9BACT|nr:polysaccharide deacetylase family protein [Echinicola strongylocentroti]AWW32525.1 polysaccharide deacetylase family protein [Echinicola strongylocentroti]
MNKKRRNIFAQKIAKAVINLGLLKRAKNKALNGDHILSIYFHKPTKEEFEGLIIWLKNNGFHFISVSALKKIIYENAPFPKGAVLITVDDGWSSNVENMAHIAKKHQTPITIFLATEAIEIGYYWFSTVKKASKQNLGFPSSEEMKKLPNAERSVLLQNLQQKTDLGEREAMTIQDVKSITNNPFVTFGAHTHTHPILPNCTDQEAHLEVQISKEKVSSWTGMEVDTFAYPNGDYGDREIDLLKKKDFKIGFSTKAVPLTRDDFKTPYTLPRLGFLEGASWEENLCRIMGVWYSKSTFKN